MEINHVNPQLPNPLAFEQVMNISCTPQPSVKCTSQVTVVNMPVALCPLGIASCDYEIVALLGCHLHTWYLAMNTMATGGH